MYNIYKTKILFNILFIRRKLLRYKMQETDNLLDHVNKVKMFTDQLACLEVPVKNKNIVMTLLKSLSASHDYLITVMEMMSMKGLTMDYVNVRLMHEMSKPKEKKTQGEDVPMVLR